MPWGVILRNKRIEWSLFFGQDNGQLIYLTSDDVMYY